MILSFVIKVSHQFLFRWLFGAGLFVFILSLTIFQYRNKSHNNEFNFVDSAEYYIGTILDIPEAKPRSFACKVKISPTNKNKNISKKVVLYFEKSNDACLLKPGDEIVFQAQLTPFQNFGNPDDFNYVRYMEIKGFSASCYIPAESWRTTGRENMSIYTLSQRFRSKALDFYKSFDLEPDAYAFISAITLGYKNDLSEKLQEAFRISGTAHVLAVSGLHVGIIYLVINLMFSFLGKHGKRYVFRQLIVIIILWWYVFIAGMSASVVRAAIMLTINCIGNISHRKGFTYNKLAAAAFFILIYNPYSLFDVSFQLSFGAVLAILYFQPKIQSLYSPTNLISKYLWNMSTVTLAAQLGIFPLVLYYFGTFPTYFFITNLLVVPLVGLIIYIAVPLIILSFPVLIKVGLFELIRTTFQWLVKTLVEITLRIVYLTESLPLAQLSDHYLSVLQTTLLLFSIYTISYWISHRNPRQLIAALTSFLFFLATIIINIYTKPEPLLTIFNSNNKSDIAIFYDKKRHFIEIPENGILPHPNKSVLRLSNNSLNNYYSENRLKIDILILSGEKHTNINYLLSIIDPSIIILDSSIPKYLSNKISSECSKLGVETHDVKKGGAYSLIF